MTDKPWAEGKDEDRRKKVESSDHDTLIEIKTTLHSNGKKLDDFIAEAKQRFNGHDKDIKWTNSVIYGAIGAFVFLEFILKVVK